MVDVVVIKKCVNTLLCRVLDIILYQQYMYGLFYASNPSAMEYVDHDLFRPHYVIYYVTL